MLEEFPAKIKVEEISSIKGLELESAIGHADTALILGVPLNRINVKLRKGDEAVVAQLQGGRLPEGSTKLPEGFEFKFLKVSVQ